MTTASSLEQAKAYIDAIDFSMVIDKIVATKGWKKKDVECICALYRNYLYLKRKYYHEADQLPPSEEIDEFWHNHILDTKKYINDCERIFGCYLHHYPYFGIDGKTNQTDAENAFERTQSLHFKEFGDYIYTVRNVFLSQIVNIAKSLMASLKSNT